MLRNKKALMIFIQLFFFSQPVELKENPPPRSLSEIKNMMRITIDQHILPAGAQKDILEELLRIGEVILFFDHTKEIPWMSSAGILVQAPVELVYDVVSDTEHMPGFVPMTEKAVLHNLGGGLYRSDITIRIKMSFLSYRLSYSLYDYRQPPYRLDWSLCEGEFDINVGFWELIPSSDGKNTMAFYSVYSEPTSKFLRSLYEREPILEMMTNLSTATMIVRAIKKESERRAKESSKGAFQPLRAKKSIEDVLALDPETMRKFLQRGKLLVLEDREPVYVSVGALVNSEIDQSYRIVSDFKSYPRFVPAVKRVNLLEEGDIGPRYKWELYVDLGFVQYSTDYIWEYEFKPKERISWQIQMKGKEPALGFWNFIPMDNGKKTLIFKGATADLRSMGFIPRYALKVEPTLEYAILACQAMAEINAIKEEIEKNKR